MENFPPANRPISMFFKVPTLLSGACDRFEQLQKSRVSCESVFGSDMVTHSSTGRYTRKISTVVEICTKVLTAFGLQNRSSTGGVSSFARLHAIHYQQLHLVG